MDMKIYLIFADSQDDGCMFAGYVRSAASAEQKCKELNAGQPDYYPVYQFEELDDLEVTAWEGAS